MFRRSFVPESYWNKPVTGVAVDPNSAKYIAALKASESRDRIGIGTGSWAMGFFDAPHQGATTTITARDGKKVSLHIGPIPIMSGNDKAAVYRCFGCDLEVSVFEYDPATHRCTNFGVYHPSTLGISGSQGNLGHRGIPPSAMFISAQELIDGFIGHRLKMGVASPADKRLDGKPMPIYPMDGYEKGHGSALPEGAVLRLRSAAYDRVKPTGASATIAKAMRDYGVICGETGGHATIKAQLGVTLPSGTSTALDKFGFSDYAVLLLGFGKA